MNDIFSSTKELIEDYKRYKKLDVIHQFSYRGKLEGRLEVFKAWREYDSKAGLNEIIKEIEEALK